MVEVPLEFRNVLQLSCVTRPAFLSVLGELILRLEGVSIAHASAETFDHFYQIVDELERNYFILTCFVITLTLSVLSQ